MKSPSAGPALTLAWTCGSFKHFISAPLAICSPLKGSSLSLSGRGSKGVACTFLTQLAGPYFSNAPLSPLAPGPLSSPLSSPPVLSALLCRCQSLTPLKESTLCCSVIADVSSHSDWQPGLLTSSPGVAGGLAGRSVCAHEIWWYTGMHTSVQAGVCACSRCVYE